jgi:hypothetical protein
MTVLIEYPPGDPGAPPHRQCRTADDTPGLFPIVARPKNRSLPVLVTDMRRTRRITARETGVRHDEEIASVGAATAATTGVLLLTGSPASAQTTHAPARPGVAYVQTSAVADRHYGDHHYGDHRVTAGPTTGITTTITTETGTTTSTSTGS